MPDNDDYVDLLERVVMNRLGAGRSPQSAAAPGKKGGNKPFDPAARAEEIFFGEASGGDPIAQAAARVRGGGGGGGRDAMHRVSTGGGPTIDAVSGAAPNATPPPAPEPFRRPAMSVGPTGSRLNRADAWLGQKLWRDMPNAVVGALIPRRESIDAVGDAVRWLMANPDAPRGR